MEITGILKVKSDAVQVSEKFKKRDFVITENSSQYPQHISLQLTQDKCGLVDSIKIGDEIKVHINIRGRIWVDPKGEEKYFNTLEAWRIETLASGNGTAPPAKQATSAPTNSGTAPVTQVNTSFSQQEGDDLPF